MASRTPIHYTADVEGASEEASDNNRQLSGNPLFGDHRHNSSIDSLTLLHQNASEDMDSTHGPKTLHIRRIYRSKSRPATILWLLDPFMMKFVAVAWRRMIVLGIVMGLSGALLVYSLAGPVERTQSGSQCNDYTCSHPNSDNLCATIYRPVPGGYTCNDACSDSSVTAFRPFHITVDLADGSTQELLCPYPASHKLTTCIVSAVMFAAAVISIIAVLRMYRPWMTPAYVLFLVAGTAMVFIMASDVAAFHKGYQECRNGFDVAFHGLPAPPQPYSCRKEKLVFIPVIEGILIVVYWFAAAVVYYTRLYYDACRQPMLSNNGAKFTRNTF